MRTLLGHPDDDPDDTGTGDRPAPHVVGPDDAAEVLSATPRNPGRIRTSWTAADIMAMEFTPPKWAVPGVLSEGCNLLCGPPKVGKSWMSLGLGPREIETTIRSGLAAGARRPRQVAA